MRQGKVKVTATIEGWLPIGNCEFEVTISKDSIECSLPFYGSVTDWKAFGKKLLQFPMSVEDQVKFEIGSKHSLVWLTLTAYCYDEKGHTALRMVMSKNEAEPHSCRLSFSIPAEAASINQLRFLLSNWQPINGFEITWEAQTS